MNRERKISILKRCLVDVWEKGDELIAICPVSGCSSKTKEKYKLSINLISDNFNCWVCHFKGKTLLPILRMRASKQEIDEYIGELTSNKATGKEIKDFDTPYIPKEYIPLSKHVGSYYELASNYLKRRGVTRSDILRYKIGYADSGEYAHRLIFPSFNSDGVLNFFTTRTLNGDRFKYKHGSFDKDIIFNDYLVDWSKPIVITEGIFDAIVAGSNSIPLLGTTFGVDTLLFKKILFNGNTVYLALDSDAAEIQDQIAKNLMSYGIDVFCVDLNGNKDVGSVTRSMFKDFIDKSFKVESEMDLIRNKLRRQVNA